MHLKPHLLLTVLLIVALVLAACGAPGSSQSTQTPDPTSGLPQTSAAATNPPTASTSETPGTQTPGTQTPGTQTPGDVAVTAVNVGYGDAILVQLNNQNFLIDTGQKKAGAQLLCALAAQGVQRLDGIFLTHPHSDHIGGLKTVAQRYEVGMLYAPGIALDLDKTNELAADLGIDLKRLSAGDQVAADSGAVFEVLGPLTLNKDDDNDNSLVLRLKAGGLTWLLTGDMQFAEESSLMQAGMDFKADILKVGNHGNPDATSDSFAGAVSPSAAIISTSTEEDNDSANPRVVSALGSADIYVTQEYTLGAVLTARDGLLTAADLVPQSVEASVSISIDAAAQTATLSSDADADLSGWFIWSEKGSELFVFPQGAAIKAGTPLIVACRGGTGDYIWDDKKVWSDKPDEAGALYTGSGALAARSK
jgi:competence protein ComEC